MADGAFIGNRKVLVIDDSALILRSVKNQLQEYDVSIATSGQMGIDKAIAEHPDVILLDYEMPGMNGNATFEQLLKDESTKNIPVIFLTGVSDEGRVGRILEKHPAGYILKPLDIKKVRARIEEVLGVK